MIPEKIKIGTEAFTRIPSGTSWDDLTKIVNEKQNYSGFLIYVDKETYKLLKE